MSDGRGLNMRMGWLVVLAWAIALAGSPAEAGSSDPQTTAYLDNALKLLRDKHINSARADWPKLEAAAREKVKDARTTADTYPAIRAVLQALGEKHSFLVEPRPPASSGSRDQDGSSSEAKVPMPWWRSLQNNVGLVWLPTLITSGEGGVLAGTKYAATLRSGLQQIDKTSKCGWIIDLRQNGGGNMWPMLQGLDPLLGQAPFGHFVLPQDRTMPWIRTAGGIVPSLEPWPVLEPHFALQHGNAPIAVLIGPQTASSGEMVAIALIGRAQVRTFGLPTAGFSTANESYPLGDGAILVITVTTVRDRRGTDYLGPVYPDEKTANEPAEGAALRWLKTRCP